MPMLKWIRVSWLRHFLCVGSLFLILGVSAVGSENSDEIPPMPKGYASEEMLKLGILMGQIKTIDAENVPVPDTP